MIRLTEFVQKYCGRLVAQAFANMIFWTGTALSVGFLVVDVLFVIADFCGLITQQFCFSTFLVVLIISTAVFAVCVFIIGYLYAWREEYG